MLSKRYESTEVDREMILSFLRSKRYYICMMLGLEK